MRTRLNVTLVPLAAGVFHTVAWVPGVIRDLHPAMAEVSLFHAAEHRRRYLKCTLF